MGEPSTSSSTSAPTKPTTSLMPNSVKKRLEKAAKEVQKPVVAQSDSDESDDEGGFSASKQRKRTKKNFANMPRAKPDQKGPRGICCAAKGKSLSKNQPTTSDMTAPDTHRTWRTRRLHPTDAT